MIYDLVNNVEVFHMSFMTAFGCHFNHMSSWVKKGIAVQCILYSIMHTILKDSMWKNMHYAMFEMLIMLHCHHVSVGCMFNSVSAIHLSKTDIVHLHSNAFLSKNGQMSQDRLLKCRKFVII